MSTGDKQQFSKLDREVLIDQVLAQLETTKAISAGKLSAIKNAASTRNTSLDKLLIKSGAAAEVDVLSIIAKFANLECDFKLTNCPVDFPTTKNLGTEFVRRSNILPLVSHSSEQIIATAEPLNFAAIEMLEFALERPVRPLLSTSNRIREVLADCLPEKTPQKIDDKDQVHADLSALANEAPVVRHVHDVLSMAVDNHASDIHFESTRSGLKTRFRIDGVLTEPAVDRDVKPDAVISRLKYMAKLNISERRKPQDGRILFTYGGRDIDLRLSILPTQYGQSAVIRVLDQSAVRLDWAALGFAEADTAAIRNILHQPNGLFLVTGPTGSGKTTTLYTALQDLNDPGRKIFTIEDPIEYNLEGVNQVQVHEEVGLTFAAALRSILRQDPNIILLGEIRDAETAEMACRAALVGRLVLSTLHTNSAAQARVRLRDLGVAEYLIDAVLKGVLGQVLEPQACAGCGGDGCEVCGGTGVGKRRLRYELVG